MKTATIVALLILVAGAYMEYQKDSSFGSVSTSSILLGAGTGVLIGNML
jgi:hypothetical protein